LLGGVARLNVRFAADVPGGDVEADDALGFGVVVGGMSFSRRAGSSST